MKRLGEFRSKLRNYENKMMIKVSDYKDGTIKEFEIDMVTDTAIFFRVVEEDE